MSERHEAKRRWDRENAESPERRAQKRRWDEANRERYQKPCPRCGWPMWWKAKQCRDCYSRSKF